MSTSKFLGLDAPTRMNAEVDAEEVSFTIEFETPGAPHKMDASLDILRLEIRHSWKGSRCNHSTCYAPSMIDAKYDVFGLEDRRSWMEIGSTKYVQGNRRRLVRTSL